jgi:hypothetical protein
MVKEVDNPFLSEADLKQLEVFTVNYYLNRLGRRIDLMTRHDRFTARPEDKHELVWRDPDIWWENDFRDQYGLNDTSMVAHAGRVLHEFLLEAEDVPDPVHTPPDELKKILIEIAMEKPEVVRERMRKRFKLSPEQIAAVPSFGRFTE